MGNASRLVCSVNFTTRQIFIFQLNNPIIRAESYLIQFLQGTYNKHPAGYTTVQKQSMFN